MSNYTDGYNEGYDTALNVSAAALARLREENARLRTELLSALGRPAYFDPRVVVATPSAPTKGADDD